MFTFLNTGSYQTAFVKNSRVSGIKRQKMWMDRWNSNASHTRYFPNLFGSYIAITKFCHNISIQYHYLHDCYILEKFVHFIYYVLKWILVQDDVSWNLFSLRFNENKHLTMRCILNYKMTTNTCILHSLRLFIMQ